MEQRIYAAIDLKSFYSSVECVARGLNPLTTNLVVADVSRTEKTICLAVSPSLKAYGLGGRARLFEVVQKMREVNAQRRKAIHWRRFTGKSCFAPELQANPMLEADYIAATPRMAEYIRVSSQIYGIYLRHIAPEDIHVYSIDEVFIDLTPYLKMYSATAHELTMRLVREVLRETGITATAGIGTNLYLCKVAMDIVAKHMEPDKDGVRIAELDEMSYRRLLWDHTPLTDFWRVGSGTAARLSSLGVGTMGDLARLSLTDEPLLYKIFGVNAELLIDHAWGWESVGMKEIKQYRPLSSSLGNGQVLKEPYSFTKARTVIKEMADSLALDLLEKHLVCTQIVLDAGYDRKSLEVGDYRGKTRRDWYGRTVPEHAHGSYRFSSPTNSARGITQAALSLFDSVINPELYIRRLSLTAAQTTSEDAAPPQDAVQLDLFEEPGQLREIEEKRKQRSRERKLQEATLRIKKTYGKNSLLKGTDFEEGATQIERNTQIGGHKA